MNEEINTNPFTGEKYTREITDYGIETKPHQSCFPRSRVLKLGKWVEADGLESGTTNTISLNMPPSEIIKALEDAARGLSQMTGLDIKFHAPQDFGGCVWGDYGFFIVNKTK